MLHLKTESGQHLPVGLYVIARCGEHIAGNGGIDTGTKCTFAALFHQISPCCQPDIRFRNQEEADSHTV